MTVPEPVRSRANRLAATLPLLLAAAAAGTATAQAATAQDQEGSRPARATVHEATRVLDTYPFSDPNPVPVLARDPRLYPYHTFEGYSAAPEPREWKVVTLENDLIRVFVLPEIGGKVWGAEVKATGREFIYRNEVVKFRNIALRGPWTSGGIEFNFGVIGHTPATATPVDYACRENDDGSASCFVGAMDLPSRTHWRVEIRLPPDQAYFETRVLWHNPTPLEQPYYNWMTAAAFARDDLELFVPGRSYLEHAGRERPWPEDESGRYLPMYRNNAFGGHKSYHVVGELNDFFGGYYHDEDWGWGHWARYEEMPGQKMWLWALSRAGGVWEDLLTDDDGQYVEFQAGRLFVQYSPDDPVANPITQVGFDPMSSSRWTETWFPLQGTGGMSDASRGGAMHAWVEGDSLRVAVHAFGAAEDTLEVWSGARPLAAVPVRLAPLTPLRTSFRVAPDQPYRVRLAAVGLDYESDSADRLLSRPFATEADAWATAPEPRRLAFEARQLALGRRYGEARRTFQQAADDDPWNRNVLLGLAELALRSARYEEGLAHARRALQLDTYDPKANFLAGNLYSALGRTADARDAFGWSARSMAFRAASYARLAEVATAAGAWDEAKRYAELALDFDRHSVPAWQVLAIRGRTTADHAAATHARARLLEIDPLHHFVLAEEYLAVRSAVAERRFRAALRSEYPGQTVLELAVGYVNRGLPEDALALLELALVRGTDAGAGADGTDARAAAGSDVGSAGLAGAAMTAWRAYLLQDPSLLADPGEPAFAFPFRVETLPVLRWAAAQSRAAGQPGSWVWTYLLGLNLWALNREEEAAQAMESLADEPDYGPSYAARGLLLQAWRGRNPEVDLSRAAALDPESRVLRIALIRHRQSEGDWERALVASAEARRAFPDDFDLELLHARGLVNTDQPLAALEILAAVRVLPSENSRESHRLFELAHIAAALDALAPGGSGHAAARAHLEAALDWPESLGQGRPYDPDERWVRYLLGVAATQAGDPDAARRHFQEVVDATPILGLSDADAAAGAERPAGPLARADLPAVLAIRALGRAAALGGVEAVVAAVAAAGNDPRDLEGRLLSRTLALSP